MLVAGQRALRVRFIAQILDGCQYFFFLQQKGIAQVLGPVQIFIHARQKLGEGGQRLDAGIPVKAVNSSHGILAAQVGMFARPARRLNNLQWIGGGNQQMRQHAVGIQRHRRQHGVNFALAEQFIVSSGRDGTAEHHAKRHRQ